MEDSVKWMSTKWLTMIRDLISIGVGAFGLVHSQLTGRANSWLVLAYLALLGVPAAINLLELKKGSIDGSKKGSSSSED